MATLIQSKQIQGIVTASNVEGNFNVEGSIVATGSDSIFGAITASAISSSGPIYGVRYNDIQGTPNFVAGTGILITQVGNDIIITNTGGGGGVSGSVELITDVTRLKAYTGSNDIIITGLENFTASIQSQVDSLTSATSSYLTELPSGLISSSDQLISSLDNRYSLSGSVGGGSSTDISALNEFTQSSDQRITNLENFSSSLNSTFATDSELSSLSSSIATTIDNIQHTQIPSGVISGSTFADFSSSVESRLSTLEGQTDNTGSDTQTLSIIGDQLTISDGNTITIPTGSVGGGGSTDISALNEFTQSIQSQVDSLTSATSSYLTELPSGLVSGSVLRSLDGTGVLSGSIVEDLSASLDSRISVLENKTDLTGSDSQSLSIVGDQLTISGGNTVTIPTGSDVSLPNGLISSSQQIEDLGFVTSALDSPFDGNRVVSNTLLGDLYSQSYNAGTSGSLRDFIEEVFFPGDAPVAEFTNQTNNFNTNLATNNTNLVSVSLTDTVDNSPYTLVLSGTNASSLIAVPTNEESSSWEIRANGNLSADTYNYNVTVGDSTNLERVYSGRSITIQQADIGTLSTNGTFYIIESATSGVITLSSSGIPGSVGSVSVSYSPNYGAQSATNFQSSNSLISINSSNGQLSVGSPISGSGNVSGDIINSTITFEDQYGNVGSGSISVNVTENSAPDIVFSNSSILNTNQATGSSGTLVTISFTDTEGDSINFDSFTFTDPSNQLQSTKSGNNYLITAISDLSSSNYTITCSIEDIHGFRTNTETHTFSISQADNGTLGGDTSIYIIESATSGDSFRDATGFGNGNTAQLSVSYSPNYGSQVATLSSSNPAIVVDGSGNLTLGVDLSGSVTQSGDSFTSLISWTDQYGNTDNGTITATVFANQSPSATFTDNGLSDVTAVSGSDIGTLTVTDTESNSPFVVTLGGTDGGKFDVNGSSSPFQIQPTGSLSIGDYLIQITVTDSYGKQSVLNETISVSSDSDYGKVYIYTNTRTGGGTLSDGNYDALLGITSENTSLEPDLITGYQELGPSPIYELKTGELGASSITVGGGIMTLRAEVSGSNLDTIISSSFSGDGVTSEQIMIIFPSGSDMSGIPTSMTDSLGGSTNGEYVLYLKAAGESSFTAAATQIHMFDVDSAVEGYTRWNIIGRNSVNTAASYEVRLIPSSGSAPL